MEKSSLNHIKHQPVFMFCGSIALSAILEPIRHLSGGQTGGFRQFPLLPWTRIGILRIPVPQHASGLFFETITRLLAIPYGAWQWEFSSDTIFTHSAQWSACEIGEDLLEILRFY